MKKKLSCHGIAKLSVCEIKYQQLKKNALDYNISHPDLSLLQMYWNEFDLLWRFEA